MQESIGDMRLEACPGNFACAGTPETYGAAALRPRLPGPGGERQTPAETSANGAAAQNTQAALDDKTQAFWRGKLMTANFGGAVSLFMRSPAHRHYTLADLEWCLLPPLALNQFMVAEATLPNGQAMPTAIVLWARVSAEIDARLSGAPRYPIRLHPSEWQSGDAIWIVDAVGEAKSLQQCIEAHKFSFRPLLFFLLPHIDARLIVKIYFRGYDHDRMYMKYIVVLCYIILIIYFFTKSVLAIASKTIKRACSFLLPAHSDAI